MSDTSINKIIQYGTDAARIAFTPAPASGSQVLYLWYTTDTLTLYLWNGAAWVSVTSGTSNILTASGTINNAAIIAMRTSSVNIIPAPGVGFFIQPRFLRCIVDTTAGAYTNIITAGGSNAWFECALDGGNSFGLGFLFDDTSLGANIVAGAPITPQVLPGFNPAAFTSVFGVVGKQTFAMRNPYQDFTVNAWGVVEYGYDLSLMNNKNLNFFMGNDGAAGNLTGGNVANALHWYLEYEIVAIP